MLEGLAWGFWVAKICTSVARHVSWLALFTYMPGKKLYQPLERGTGAGDTNSGPLGRRPEGRPYF